MASSRVILIEDLPPELQQNIEGKSDADWEVGLELWVSQLLDDANGKPVLEIAMPRFERVIINAALRKSSGRKKDAAELLGWGRNTLTRKMQELDY